MLKRVDCATAMTSSMACQWKRRAGTGRKHLGRTSRTPPLWQTAIRPPLRQTLRCAGAWLPPATVASRQYYSGDDTGSRPGRRNCGGGAPCWSGLRTVMMSRRHSLSCRIESRQNKSRQTQKASHFVWKRSSATSRSLLPAQVVSTPLFKDSTSDATCVQRTHETRDPLGQFHFVFYSLGLSFATPRRKSVFSSFIQDVRVLYSVIAMRGPSTVRNSGTD